MRTVFTLQEIDFEWDNRKAASNLRKHEIEFVEACEVFFDPFLQAQRDEFVEGERREAIIGMTSDWQLLYVVYVWRDERIRLISARPVTRQEKIRYEGQ